MAEKRDYYEVLGVDKSATQDEIKKAFRKITKANHPDLHPGDKECEERFKEANEAYEVLSDEEKRKKYDQFGHAAFDPSAGYGGAGYGGAGGFGGGAQGGGNPFGGFDFSGFTGGGGFSQFFQDLFGRTGKQGGGFGGFQGFSSGGGFGRQPRQHSGEMNANVTIDLYTAMLGGEIIVTLSNGQKLKLKIKPETQPGTKVRLRGKGYDRGDGTFGDLIITYQVKLPQNLSEHQRNLLRQMREG